MDIVSTDRLRNVVLLSHSGAGKTTLAEAILFTSGAITRMGRVEDGSTVSDFEPEEQKRRSSIQASVLPCMWSGVKVNLLDTPGYADFQGEVVSALRVADAAILVVAAPSRVEVGTELMWRHIQERRLPCLIFINKMERENADFNACLQRIQQRFGKQCVAISVPVGSEAQFQGVIDILELPDAVPVQSRQEVEAARGRLTEAVAESDEGLTNSYLEKGELSLEEVRGGLRQAILSGVLVPVLAGSAAQNLGVRELMEAIASLMPSPVEVPGARATGSVGGEAMTLACIADSPLAALVFKTTADPFVGKLSYFRVYSGTIRSNGEVWNANRGQSERIGQLFTIRGKSQEQAQELVAGDIGAVAKLSATATGDTLCRRDMPWVLEGVQFPKPIYTVAVHPKSKQDVDKMSTALNRLGDEDPTIMVGRDPGTGEVVLSGLGDVHVDVVAEKARRKFGVELQLSPPQVAYKETITRTTQVEYRHKKQTGGHGQYGHVLLRLEPLSWSKGHEFVSAVVGGNVPREYIPAVEKGVVKAMDEGALAGYPIVGVRVVLYDGSSHPVDSSGMSFEIAGGHGLRKGVQQAGPALLEPIMKLRVVVPDQFTGDVIGDLNSKRARILGMLPEGGVTVVEAEAPQAELLRYATDVRSLTQGRGSFTMEFSQYEVVPQHLAQRIIDEAKAAAASRG